MHTHPGHCKRFLVLWDQLARGRDHTKNRQVLPDYLSLISRGSVKLSIVVNPTKYPSTETSWNRVMAEQPMEQNRTQRCADESINFAQTDSMSRIVDGEGYKRGMKGLEVRDGAFFIRHRRKKRGLRASERGDIVRLSRVSTAYNTLLSSVSSLLFSALTQFHWLCLEPPAIVLI